MHPHSRAGYPRLCITPWAPPAPRHSPGGCEHSPCCSHALRRERRGWGHPRAQPCWEQQQSGVGIPHDSKAKGGPTRPPPEGYQQILALLRWGTGKQPWCKQRAKGAAAPSPPAVTPRGQGQAGKESVLQRGQEGMILVPPARPHSLGAALRGGLSPLQSRTPPRVLAGGSYCLRWSPGRLLPGVLHN